MRHKQCSRFAVVATSICGGAFIPAVVGQQIIDDNAATPVERRVMLETTLSLNGVDYAVTAEHVLYDGDDLTRVYHYPHYKSKPLRRLRQFAIEVSLKPVGAVDTKGWIAFRVSAPPFGPSSVGFIIAPPVVGVGVLRRGEGDRLMVAKWNMSTNWSSCLIWGIDPERHMAPVPKIMHHMSGKWTPAVDDVWILPLGPEYMTAIPLTRSYYVDPDCRLFLSGDEKAIEVVRGAWSRHEYTIETHRYNIETGEVTVHPPTPQQTSLFDAMPLLAPPQHIRMGDLPRPIHNK